MTKSDTSRRNFLLGKLNSSGPDVMRPPGATPAFERDCTRCGDCLKVCPTAIIVVGEDRLPRLDFSDGACTFCGECAKVCPTEALDPDLLADWRWKAEVTEACLSLKGIMCRACEDVCEPRAIRFRLEPGGRSRPVIDVRQCTGCGACAQCCPASALTFFEEESASREATK